VKAAIEIAWRLAADQRFIRAFRKTVAAVAGKALGRAAYSMALNKMVINHAEGSRDPRIQRELKQDLEAVQKVPGYRSAPALSFPNGTHIWIRTFRLRQSSRAIAADIVHEGAHLAGAPAVEFIEPLLDVIHNAAALPR
jgi:hypothetical protein